MTELLPREPVILADDFAMLVDWYRDTLGFDVVKRFEETFHYCNLETSSGIKLGIGSAKETGIEPTDRGQNTVILQYEVADVSAFLKTVEASGGRVIFGPSFDKDGQFWFGAFADPEGNPNWVVDSNCP